MTLTTTYNDQDIERLIDRAADRVEKRLDRRLEQNLQVVDKRLKENLQTVDKRLEQNFREVDEKIERAAERGAGAYYEKTKHDMDLILESIGLMQERFDDMPTRQEFSELRSEVKVIRLAVTDTNEDLHSLNRPGWFPGKRR